MGSDFQRQQRSPLQPRRGAGRGHRDARAKSPRVHVRWRGIGPAVHHHIARRSGAGRRARGRIAVRDRAGRARPAGPGVRRMSNQPIVTIAALYGAGASYVGKHVAERLDVPLLDRTILEQAARRSGVPEEAVADVDDEPRSRRERVISNLARATTISSPQASTGDSPELDERRLRHAIEDALAEVRTSGGVAIGRGGMVVLRTVPWALHVHLGGAREARIEQGAGLEGIAHDAPEGRQESEDRARRGYVQRAYDVDGAAPELYHLMLDSTALPLEICVDLIVTAALARVGQPRKTAPI